jgi:hypothetical protein
MLLMLKTWRNVNKNLVEPGSEFLLPQPGAEQPGNQVPATILLCFQMVCLQYSVKSAHRYAFH